MATRAPWMQPASRPALPRTPAIMNTAAPDAPVAKKRHPNRRDLPAAWRAVRTLLRDPNDTAQVFVIMQSLNGPSAPLNFDRLMRTEGGPRQAYRRVELAERFSDATYVARFAPGTVGAAYRAFLEKTGYSAAGLAEVSNPEGNPLVEHPHAWMARRIRDGHDIWHVLTGYQADEPLGEAALVAFSYAQTKGLGWAFIAVAAALQSLRVTRGTAFARAVLEGWQRGRRAGWLLGEDYEALLNEPLEVARGRLDIGAAPAYGRAQAVVAALEEKTGGTAAA